MTDMIERVARSLAESQGIFWDDCCKDPFLVDATPAIKAMREPTPEIIEAMKANIGPLAEMWRAGIDAALGAEDEK